VLKYFQLSALILTLLVIIPCLYRTLQHYLKKHDINILKVLLILIKKRLLYPHSKKDIKIPIDSQAIPLKKGKDCLLMTACIDVGKTPFVTIRNSQDRLNQYLRSVILWIIRSDIKNIIFCENSGFQYDYGFLKDLAGIYGKAIEFIAFNGNDASYSKGKGYGEGEIIKYALNNSKLISPDDMVYKITGRLYMKNFNAIYKEHLANDNVFNKLSYEIDEDKVDARFFKYSVRFYRHYLIDAYKDIDDPKGRYFEHILYSRLKGIDIPSFKLFPDYVGISATSGKDYELTSMDLSWKNMISRLGLYDI